MPIFSRSLSRRRCLAATAAIATAVALGGCGGGSSSTSSPKTIDFWSWNNEGDYVKVDQAAIARFKTSHPDVTVKVTYIPYADYITKLKASLAAGNPPDIAQIPWAGDFRDIVNSGKLLPLDSVLKTGFPAFGTPATNAVTINGHQWAVPLDLNTLQIAYNKKLFGQYGLQPPKTTADLVTIANTLKQHKVFGISLGTKDQWAGGDAWFAQLPYTDPSHTLLAKADAGQASWTDPAFVAAGNNVRGLVDAGVFAPGANSMGAFNEALDLFVGQKAAMFYPVGNFISGGIQDKVGTTFDWGLFPFPSTDGSPAIPTGGIARMFTLPKDGKHQQDAADFLRTMTDKQGEATLMKYSFIPAWPATAPADATALYKNYLAAQGQAQSRVIYTTAVYTALLNQMQSIFDGKGDGKTLSSAMSAAAK